MSSDLGDQYQKYEPPGPYQKYEPGPYTQKLKELGAVAGGAVFGVAGSDVGGGPGGVIGQIIGYYAGGSAGEAAGFYVDNFPRMIDNFNTLTKEMNDPRSLMSPFED
jgi:hypothetical protein